MNEKISIIVPVYNCEKYLKRCLDSIVTQTYSNLEIIIVDDGSSDDSGVICKEFAKRDHRIIYEYQENRGVSYARNRGLDLVTGDFVAFCDADDWMDETLINVLYNLLITEKSDVSIVSYVNEVSNLSPAYVDDYKVIILDKEEAANELLKGSLFQGHLWNKLFKKEILENSRFDTDIFILEDLLFVWSAFKKAKTIVFSNRHLYHYFFNPNSALHQSFDDSYWTRRIACERIYNDVSLNFRDAIPFALKNIILSDIVIAEKLILSHCITKENKLLIKTEIRNLYTRKIAKYLGNRRIDALLIKHFFPFFKIKVFVFWFFIRIKI